MLNKNKIDSINHLVAVDAIRGWAILGVMIIHVATAIEPSIFAPLAHEGARGVQLFFMASAFTLFMSLELRQNEAHNIANYFIRRFFRIAPLYYIATAFWVISHYYGSSVATFVNSSPAAVLSTVFFINGAHPQAIQAVVPGGWSVAVETNFYLLLPIFARYVRTLNTAIKVALGISAVGTMLGVIGYLIAPHIWSGNDLVVANGYFAEYWLPVSMPAFMGGMVVYFVYKENVWQWASSSVALIISGAFMLGLSYAHIPLKNVLYVPLLAIYFLFLLRNQPALFVNAVTQNIGRISFSAYLLHFGMIPVALWILPSSMQSFTGLLLVTIILTLSASFITFRCIEGPGRKLGQYLIKNIQNSFESRQTIRESQVTN